MLPVAASLLGLLALRLLGPDWVNQERLQAWLAPMGVWAPVVFLAFLVVRPVTLLPGQLFAAVGGMLFGLWAGVGYALLGSLLSGVLVHVLARRLGTERMRRWLGPDYRAISASAKRHDFAFNFAACVNPLAPTDVMLALSASTGARLVPSVLGVLVGSIPGTLLTVLYGKSLGQGQTWATVSSAVGLLLSLVLGAYIGRRVYREVLAGRADGSADTGPLSGGAASGASSGSGSDSAPSSAPGGERARVSRGTSRSTSAPVSFPPPRVT